MKITDLGCAVIANAPIVQIRTDGACRRKGQIETPKPYVKPQVLDLKDWIVGQDPRDVERVMRASASAAASSRSARRSAPSSTRAVGHCR